MPGPHSVISPDQLAIGEKLANETKQDVVIAQTRSLSGAGVAGTLALTSGNTWYAVPTTVPTSDYVLVISKENAAGTVRWSFANVSAPSATYGNQLATNDVILELAGGEVVYVGSSTAGDDVNWTTKVI